MDTDDFVGLYYMKVQHGRFSLWFWFVLVLKSHCHTSLSLCVKVFKKFYTNENITTKVQCEQDLLSFRAEFWFILRVDVFLPLSGNENGRTDKISVCNWIDLSDDILSAVSLLYIRHTCSMFIQSFPSSIMRLSPVQILVRLSHSVPLGSYRCVRRSGSE